MPVVTISDLGIGGIVRDLPDFLLPPELWSAGTNVRFDDRKVTKFLGHQIVFDPPTVTPFWARPVFTPAGVFWVYSDKLKMYAFDGATHADITRAVGGDYGATNELLWNGGRLSTIPIFNNGIDVPQIWSPISLAQRLIDLTGWPAGFTCRVLRPYKSHLVMFNVTESGTDYPSRIKWSHPADPGTLPSSWDESDPAFNAGERDLDDPGAGAILDALDFGDEMIIYKEQSIWTMQFVGGQSIFRTTKKFDSLGLMTNDCVTNVPNRRQHLLYTGEDLVVHDGVKVESIVDERWKKFLLSNIDAANYQRSFMFDHRSRSEIWFCFPEVGATTPTLALVWNWLDNNFSVRELVNINWIAAGPIAETSSDAWDVASGTWDTDTDKWDNQTFRAFQFDPLLCDIVADKFYQGDQTNQFNGTNFLSSVSRTGLAIVGRDRRDQPIVDFSVRKLMTRIWPKMTGGPINVYAGVQESRGGAVTWSPAMPFDPTTQQYVDVDPPLAGRLLAARFESNADVTWELEGYDLEMSVLGAF